MTTYSNRPDVVGRPARPSSWSKVRRTCSFTNVASLTARRERSVDVSGPSDVAGEFVVWIQVEALDRARLLRDVTSVISDTGANITASSTNTGQDRVAILKYEVELSDPSQLPRLLTDLRGVDGVYTAFRLANDPSTL